MSLRDKTNSNPPKSKPFLFEYAFKGGFKKSNVNSFQELKAKEAMCRALGYDYSIGYPDGKSVFVTVKLHNDKAL